MPGKGLAVAAGGAGGGGQAAAAAQLAQQAMVPSGVMFVCALLVAKRKSITSNVGDKDQDVITMLHEHACLPCYVIKTRCLAQGGGMYAAPPQPEAFAGAGLRLGGD